MSLKDLREVQESHTQADPRPMMEEAISKRYQEEGPPSFYCPIGLELMCDPVILVEVRICGRSAPHSCGLPAAVPLAFDVACARCVFCSAQTGHTFERANIEAHLAVSNRGPMCGTELQEKTLVANHAMRNAIEEYLAHRAALCAEQRSVLAASSAARPATPAPATNEQPLPPASNKQPPPPVPPPPPPPAGNVVTITRGTDGSVGMRFRRSKGCSSGPLEVIDVKPGGPAEFSGLGMCEYLCARVHTSMHKYTHAYTRTHTHTLSRAHAYSQRLATASSPWMA